MLDCPTRNQLTNFLSGRLPRDVFDVMAGHIEGCERCHNAARLADDCVDDLISSLRELVTSFSDEPELRQALADVGSDDRRAAEEWQDRPTRDADRRIAALPRPERIRRYQILDVVARGGMGTVYKALHTQLDKIVAVKVLAPERVEHEDSLARFEREMKAVGKFDHPNIVRAFDAGRWNGAQYLVMEFVDGVDLGRLVKAAGKLPVADACEVIRQATVGLQHVHEHGMVHRDIKPSNMMLTRDGVLKILDLGVARFNAEIPLPADQTITGHLQNTVCDLTYTGQYLGTSDYMAPEQWKNTHRVDIRTDIYSLGCTLYHLLSGRVPFDGSGRRSVNWKMRAHLKFEPTPIQELCPEIPDALAAIVHKMLAKRPVERYNAPNEVAQALAPFISGSDLGRLLDSSLVDASSGPRITTSYENAVEDGARVDSAPAAVDEPLIAPMPLLRKEGARLMRKQDARRLRPVILWVVLGVTVLFGAAFVVSLSQREKRPETSQANFNTAGETSGRGEEQLPPGADDSISVKDEPGLPGNKTTDVGSNANGGGSPSVSATGPDSSVRPRADSRPTTVASRSDARSAIQPDDKGLKPADIQGKSTHVSNPVAAKPPRDDSPDSQRPDSPAHKKTQVAIVNKAVVNKNVQQAATLPPPRFASATDKPKYLRHLRTMLASGFDDGRAGLKVARSHYEQAKLLCRSDPRLDYAYGLVMMRNMKHKQAIEKFRASTQLHEYPYLPAWRALIRQQVLSRQRASGMGDMLRLAGYLRRSESVWPDAAARNECAAWLGRVMGVLPKPVKLGFKAAELKNLDASIRKQFDETLRASYERGKREVRAEYNELKREEITLRDESEKKRKIKTKERQSKITAKKQKLKKRLKKLDLNNAQTRKQFDERLTRSEKLLVRLERDYASLDSQAKSIQASMVAIRQEIDITNGRLYRISANRRVSQNGSQNGLLRDLFVLREQRNRYQSEYNVVATRMGLVRKRAVAALGARAADVARFQRMTGEMVKESKLLKKWKKKLNSKDKKPVGISMALRRHRRKISYLSTYIVFDLKAEKQRILESYATP